MVTRKNGGDYLKIARLIKDVQFLAKVDLAFLGMGLLNLALRYYAGSTVDPAYKAYAWALTEVPFLVLVLLLITAVMMGRDNVWVSRAGTIPLLVAGLVAILGVNFFITEVYETGTDFVGYLLGGMFSISPLIMAGLVVILVVAVIYYMGSVIGRQKVKRNSH